MINRIVTFKSTAELLADKINDFIKNELNEGAYVMDIKYMEDDTSVVKTEKWKQKRL